MTQTNSPEVTVWYDGSCPLCVAEISWIRRLDARAGRIAFVDVTGKGACPLDRATLLARFHAQEAGQEVVSGVAAFGAMWRRVGVLAPLGWLASWPPAQGPLNWLYGLFLRIRPRLQAFVRSRQRTL